MWWQHFGLIFVRPIASMHDWHDMNVLSSNIAHTVCYERGSQSQSLPCTHMCEGESVLSICFAMCHFVKKKLSTFTCLNSCCTRDSHSQHEVHGDMVNGITNSHSMWTATLNQDPWTKFLHITQTVGLCQSIVSARTIYWYCCLEACFVLLCNFLIFHVHWK